MPALLDAHPGAGHAVEHPQRNFLPEVRGSPVQGASRASDARLLYDIADPHKATVPGMPPIKYPADAGPMGGLALGCTTPSARTVAWDTGHRPRKRSSRQAGRPAPLHSASHPAWRRNRQCTNLQTGPVAGGGHSALSAGACSSG